MLAALVLASVWAQAEPAPPPPPPPAAPIEEPPPPVKPNTLSVVGQLATRVRVDEQALPPRNGFGIGGSFERRLLPLGPAFELGAAVDFLYDHFETAGATAGTTDVTSDTSFALGATLGWVGPGVRPFVAVGGGLNVGYFTSSESPLVPASTTAVQPAARAAAGVDVALTTAIGLVARIDYTLTFTRPPTTTATGATYSLFGDVLHFGAGVVARF
jgi:hypothetical protein